MHSALLAAAGILLIGYVSARVGMGSCPTSYTPIAMPFTTTGTVADGQYHLMRFDTQFKWGWEIFAKQSGESLDCQFA
jgi:hypothetical protein